MLPREVSTSDVNDAIVKLKDAVTSGDLNKVSEIINFIDMGNPERQRDVHFLLRDAIDKKFMEIANLLLEKGAKVNVSDVTQGTYYNNIDSPLNLACKIGNEDLVKNILDKGADINYMERSGYTPLSTAVDKGHKNIVKMLLERGALVNTEYKEYEIQPLFSACKQGDMETVKLLLSRGADINEGSTNDYGETSTPLCIATDKNHVEIAKLLVENGAQVNKHEEGVGYSPLHFACENGNEELVSLFLSKGANVSDVPDDDTTNKYCRGFMPIHRAAINGHTKIIERLLDSGASINAVSSDVTIGGGTPLHFACINGSEELFEFLIKKGADIENDENEYGQTPLHLAVSNKQINLIKLLIENGANLNAIDHKGNTVLHLTCRAKRLKILELLLKHKLDINARNFNDCLPIHVAVSTCFKKGVELLLKLGADVNARDQFGRTPLHHVTHYINVLLDEKVDIVETVDLLVKAGADVNAKNRKGETPLHLACRFGLGTESYVQKLLNSDANINEKNENGMTPLQVAVTNGTILPSVITIEYLISYGADIEIKENTNKTALHLAYMLERSDIFVLLLNYGADINNMFDPDYVQDEAHSEDGEDYDDGLFNPFNFATTRNRNEHVAKATRGFKWIKGISAILIKHIIKLKCANLYVNERMFGEPENVPYWTECEKEVVEMKNKKLDNVSLYYIFSKHYYESTKYLMNENILKDINFKSLRKEYPIYGGMLTGKIRLASIRMLCRVTSIEYLNKVFKYKMPLLCINMTIEYLTNRDLLNFVRVVSPPTSDAIDTFITLGTHMRGTCDDMDTSAEDDVHTDDGDDEYTDVSDDAEDMNVTNEDGDMDSADEDGDMDSADEDDEMYISDDDEETNFTDDEYPDHDQCVVS